MPPRTELPTPRGPLSEAVIGRLRGARAALPDRVDTVDVATDDDAQLALTCCYELHYESFAGVDDDLEWSPEILGLRRRLEHAFLDRVRDAVGAPAPCAPDAVVDGLRALAADTTGPSLSRFVAEHGTREHLREFCVHRSEYQRKEADPHTWMIPRLPATAKAAAVAIQYDEYGAGSPAGMHSELFAATMRALGLDPSYAAYRDLLPGTTLATTNLVSMLGLHRGLRAACVGHLALFEMTSVGPMGRYAAACSRLGLDDAARAFYDVHVDADAWHEQVAQHDLVGGFVAAEPAAGGMILFGARALTHVEARMTTAILAAWDRETTSLRQPLPAPVPA
jgi:hypothetical protein